MHNDGRSFKFLEAVHRQRQALIRLWDATPDEPTDLLAVEVQSYVALAFYACMPPARSKEVRLLLGRILPERESAESLQNHITTAHGRHIAVMR